MPEPKVLTVKDVCELPKIEEPFGGTYADNLTQTGKNLAIREISELPVNLPKERISEEILSKIVQKAGKRWERIIYPITPLYVYIAKAIIKHLEGEK